MSNQRKLQDKDYRNENSFQPGVELICLFLNTTDLHLQIKLSQPFKPSKSEDYPDIFYLNMKSKFNFVSKYGMPMDEQSLILNATIPVNVKSLEESDFWRTTAALVSTVSVGSLIYYLVL